MPPTARKDAGCRAFVLYTAPKHPPVLKPGLTFSGKFLLRLSVVVIGSQFLLAEVAGVGLVSLPVMPGTLLLCLLDAWLIGRLLGIVGDLRTLIGVGVWGPRDRGRHAGARRGEVDVAYAVSRRARSDGCGNARQAAAALRS